MSTEKLKVLIISNTPWRSDNSFGNTYNSFFKGMNCEIANIYCRNGLPDGESPICRAYRITERSLLANLLNPNVSSGEIIMEREEAFPVEAPAFNVARKIRWQAMFWARDLIWKIGRWKTYQLENFVDDFAPDILFLPVYYSNYICDLDLWAIEHCGVPVFTNISDDIYSFNRSEISPLFWIDRLMKRRKIKKVVESSSILYVCSDLQKKDYRNCFNTQIKVLRKGFSRFGTSSPHHDSDSSKLQLLYTGNAGEGRWGSLLDLAQVISDMNKASLSCRFILDIYTPTPLPKKLGVLFSTCEGTNLHGPVPYSEVARLQEGADVLVHVESFKKRDRLAVRQSISTKIPDYLSRGGCILAYGPSDVASISYLRMSNSAAVATSKENLEPLLVDLFENREKVVDLKKQAISFARTNHSRNRIQDMLLKDFRSAMAVEGLTV